MDVLRVRYLLTLCVDTEFGVIGLVVLEVWSSDVEELVQEEQGGDTHEVKMRADRLSGSQLYTIIASVELYIEGTRAEDG